MEEEKNQNSSTNSEGRNEGIEAEEESAASSNLAEQWEEEELQEQEIENQEQETKEEAAKPYIEDKIKKKQFHKLRYIGHVIGEKCKYIKDKVTTFVSNSYGPTTKYVNRGLKAMISIVIGAAYGIGVTDKVPSIITALIVAVLSYLLVSLGNGIIRLLSRLLRKYPLVLAIDVILLAYILNIVFSCACLTDSTKSLMIIAVILLVFGLLFRSVGAILHNKKKNVLVFLCSGISLAAVIVMVVIYIGEGSTKTKFASYVNCNQALKEGTKTVNYEKTYTVETMTYGSSESDTIQTKSVNINPYVDYSGLTKKIRDNYWGFSLKETPVRGKIWYPKEGMHNKVLFIVHGNHTMLTKSHLGYEYLGEYLAGCGYVVVSVDENMLNGFSEFSIQNENDARAVLLLENIKAILRENRKSDSPLYQRIDEDGIAIAGHSRGGEAVAIAALYNNLDRNPECGSITYNYHFKISTVIAIAPVCDQYRPASHDVTLHDVNYFLIQGSNDQDVSVFMGSKQYNNVTFTKDGGYRKAYLYFAGANHGQFNTKWGRYDNSIPAASLYNTASLLDPEKQRDILKQYLKVCLDVTLKNDLINEDFLYNCDAYGKSLPSTAYLQAYQDSRFTCIADYEEDCVLGEGTIPGCTLRGSGLSMWREMQTSHIDYDYDRDNYAVELDWSDNLNSYYKINLGSAMNGQNVQFDILDLDNAKVYEKTMKPVDFTIRLYDTDGNKHDYLLSDVRTVYPPLEVKLSKFDYLFGTCEYKHHFQTVRIPLDDLDYKVKTIEFRFDQVKNGQIMVDNIGVD